MALIDLDKFLASFIDAMKECSQMRNFSIPRCIKKALVYQGLEYKDGEIVKTQRRISAEAKENGYGESEDERVREDILAFVKREGQHIDKYKWHKWIAWLEKQGEPIDKEKVLIGARKDVALSIMNYLDNNSVGMCLSNIECADIESAVVNSDWSKVYDYMKKKLEKQDRKPQGKSALETIKEEKAKNTRPMLSDFFNAEYERGKADALQSVKWSEEDEKIINKLIAVVELYYGIGDDSEKQICLSWLKSLKQRMGWKPSDEQMKALHDMNLTGNISYAGQGQTLIELYNDLKKL